MRLYVYRTAWLIDRHGAKGARSEIAGIKGLPVDRWRQFNTVLVNTGLTRILVGAAGPRLLSFNEHQHLAPDQVTYR